MTEDEIEKSDATSLVKRLSQIRGEFDTLSLELKAAELESSNYSSLADQVQNEIDSLESKLQEYESTIIENDDLANEAEESMGELNEEIQAIESKLGEFDYIPKGLSDDKTLDMFTDKM
jgi:chromosome segregation ATPase